jgi:uncharacterized protein (UPF0261 family)/ABC-type branched-subunit amino acid transport system ATPase component
MAEIARRTPTLEIRGLNVFYGASHALQGVDLTLAAGALSVVGRNGMGKTTLCKTIVGLLKPSSGSIRFQGQEIAGLDAAAIARLGIGYVPQGRRLWPSLTVDEHLRLTHAGKRGSWSPERVYDTFPRLAERKSNRGNQLSGGEQQMLAISRALLVDPKLLVMDEPTEGLAPVIVQQVEELLTRLAGEGDLSVLIIEQNIGVATSVSEMTAIMVNGRVNRTMPSAALAADRELQQRLLGVGRPGSHDAAHGGDVDGTAESPSIQRPAAGPVRIYVSNPFSPTRWSLPVPVERLEAAARTVTPVPSVRPAIPGNLELHPLSPSGEPVVLIAGTFDTKGEELAFMAAALRAHGHRIRLVDLSTGGKPSAADIPPHQIAAYHRRGAAGVFGASQEQSVAAMGEAFETWIRRQTGIAGLLSAGGSHGTMAVAPAMRALPLGVPKIIVSTEASGEVARIVGAADIMLMHSVSDVGGLNSVSRQVLANAAEAMAGMVAARVEALKNIRPGRAVRPELPTVGLAFDGRTQSVANALTALLAGTVEVVPFKGSRGMQALRKVSEGGLLTCAIEISGADFAERALQGGAVSDDPLSGSRIPVVIVPGAMDAISFTHPEAMPQQFLGRRKVANGASSVLVRTSESEATEIGRRLADRVNRMDCPVRIVFPKGGLSSEGRRGGPLHDVYAEEALMRAMEAGLLATANRRLSAFPHAIDDPEFIGSVCDTIKSLVGGRARPKRTMVS